MTQQELEEDRRKWMEAFRDVVHQRDRLERERDEARSISIRLVEREVHFCREWRGGDPTLYVLGLGFTMERTIPRDMSPEDYEKLKSEIRIELFERFCAKASKA